MHPFVNYFGGKWALARRYGPPQRPHMIEPFAGFAGYSTYWEPEQVTLIEKDPRLIAIWHYLQRVTAREIMRLPTEIDSVDGLRVCEEAKMLIGFWFNRGLVEPAKQRGNWARHDQYRFRYWGQKIRVRIAGQVERIRQWQIIEGDYTAAPDIDAHWFIDPPYRNNGKYRVNGIDYAKLAEWALSRKGVVQVCENTEARWLPFEPFTLVNTGACHGGPGFSAEAIYEFESAHTAF
jgi:site-specific DNA-adenine methylase